MKGFDKHLKKIQPMSVCSRCKCHVEKEGMHYHDVCKDCLTDSEKERAENYRKSQERNHELYLRRMAEKTKMKNGRNFKKGRRPCQ